MADERVNIVFEIDEKIEKLMLAYQNLQERYGILARENQQLKEDLGAKESELQYITIKYNYLKTAKAIEAGSESKDEAKDRIRKIVREIDQCITMLNT